ncbi:MAG: LPS export ABC transporter permease LptG [Gammaproteobacteria bacterium]|nr:LPS export ABC transporter permease LptG [Gammaproteobacteria bacterium]
MKLLQNYIGKTIIVSTLLVILVVLALQLFVNFVGELRDIGQGDYGPFQALIYVILGLPQAIYSFFPMAAMLGVMVGLGTLAMHNELMILRVSGVSIAQVSVMVLKTVFLMIVVVTLMGVFVAPQLVHWAEREKGLQTSGGQAITTQQGTWLKNGNKFIHVQAILPGGRLQGVTSYTFSPTHQLQSVNFSPKVNYDSHRWYFHEVVESRFFDDHVETKHVKEETLDLVLNPAFIHAAEEEPKELTLTKLYKFIAYQRSNGMHANEYLLVFWQRLMQPIASLVMIFLAIPCIFGPLRSATVGLRMIAGIAIGFGFYIVNALFGPMSIVYQFPPFFAAALPSILFFLAGVWMMRRVR